MRKIKSMAGGFPLRPKIYTLLYAPPNGVCKGISHLAQSSRCCAPLATPTAQSSHRFAAACAARFARFLRFASSLHLAQSSRCRAAACIARFASLLHTAQFCHRQGRCSGATGGASASEPLPGSRGRAPGYWPTTALMRRTPAEEDSSLRILKDFRSPVFSAWGPPQISLLNLPMV